MAFGEDFLHELEVVLFHLGLPFRVRSNRVGSKWPDYGRFTFSLQFSGKGVAFPNGQFDSCVC